MKKNNNNTQNNHNKNNKPVANKKQGKSSNDINSKGGEALKVFLISFKEAQIKLKINNFDFLNDNSDFSIKLQELCHCVNDGANIKTDIINEIVIFLRNKIMTIVKEFPDQKNIHDIIVMQNDYAKKLYDFAIKREAYLIKIVNREQEDKREGISPISHVSLVIKELIVASAGYYLAITRISDDRLDVISERIKISEKMVLVHQECFKLSCKCSFYDFIKFNPSLFLNQKYLENNALLNDIACHCTIMRSLKNEKIELAKFYLEKKHYVEYKKCYDATCNYAEKASKIFRVLLNKEGEIMDACNKLKNNKERATNSMKSVFSTIKAILSPIDDCLIVKKHSVVLSELEKLSRSVEQELAEKEMVSINACQELHLCFNKSVSELEVYFRYCNKNLISINNDINILARTTVFRAFYNFLNCDFYEVISLWRDMDEFFKQFNKGNIEESISKEMFCINKLIFAIKEFMREEITNNKVEEWLERNWQLTQLTSILPFVALPGMLWIEKEKIAEGDIDKLLVTLNCYLDNHLTKLIIPPIYRVTISSKLGDLLLFFARKKLNEKDKETGGIKELMSVYNQVGNIFNYGTSYTEEKLEELSHLSKQQEFNALIDKLQNEEKKQREQQKRKEIHEPKDWGLSSEVIEISKNDIVSNNEKKQPKSIDIIMYRDVEEKKREYAFFINTANKNNDKKLIENNSEHICENITKSIEQERLEIHNKKTPVGKFKIQLLAFYEGSVKLKHYKLKSNRLLLDLVRCINNLTECDSKEHDSNMKQLILLKTDIKDIQDQATTMRRAICNSQDVLERLAEEHGFLKENNIEILSPELEKLLEEQIEFQEHIPSDQLIDAIAILTSETIFKIYEQMEILEVAQYNLKHACYFTENFKEYLLPLIEEKIKQLTVTFSESFKEENRPNTTDIFSMGIGNSSLPNEIENNSSLNQDISQNNLVISETIDSETNNSEKTPSLLKDNLNRIKKNQKEKQRPKKIRVRNRITKETQDILLSETHPIRIEDSVNQQSIVTNNTSRENKPNNKQSHFSSSSTFFENVCSSTQLESIQCVEELLYKDTSRYKYVPTCASMHVYLQNISDVLVAKTLRIEGVDKKTVGLHLLILKLFVAFYIDYKIFSQVAVKLEKYYSDKEMDGHFNALSKVELDRMADLLDYAFVCKKLNNYSFVNNYCREIEKNKNIHKSTKNYCCSLLSYLYNVSSGIKLARDPLLWLENRLHFIAVNLDSVFSHWHSLVRLDQIHLLHSVFITLSNFFSVLLKHTEVSEVTEQNTQIYNRVWGLNEKAQFLYFYLQTLSGISGFKNVDSEEHKRLTQSVYIKKFHLQLRLLAYSASQKNNYDKNEIHENKSFNYAFN